MRFKRIYIEITNACNLACSFCIQNQRKLHRMSIEEFEHVVQQIRPYTDFVYLHILGEPLSHPDLQGILNICDEYQLKVNLTTNGTLLRKQELILKSCKALRQINVSLHSFAQPGQLDTDEYLNQVFETCEKLSKRIFISYRLWNLKNGQMKESDQYILDRINEYYQLSIKVDDSMVNRNTLKRNIFLNFEEVFEWPSMDNSKISESGNCLGIRQMCGILSNGDVVPCCLDSKGDCTLGNIYKEPFAEIMKHERWKQMEQGFHDNKLKEELCMKCSYRKRFDVS